MHGEVLCESYPKISIVLVRSNEFLIQISGQICRKFPIVMPIDVVKQIAKVHGHLVCVFINMGHNGSKNAKTLLLQIAAESFQTFSGFSSHVLRFF